MNNTLRQATRSKQSLAVIIITILTSFVVPGTNATTWNPAQQVPPNTCSYLGHPVNCVDTWPSTSNDQLGRVWLVWTEKLQGVPDSRSDVYYKLSTGGVWGSKVQITSDTNHDTNPSVASLSNGTMMILWTSNRTGTYQLFYRLYAATGAPSPLGNEVKLTNNSFNNTEPSVAEDRAGRIWVVWNRQNDIYYKYHNGTIWSSDFLLPPASSIDAEHTPTIIQRKDGRVMIAWASISTSGNGDSHPYYSTTDATPPYLPSSGIPASSWSQVSEFFTNKSNNDDKPSLAQARDGTILAFWQRTFTNDQDIYWSSSNNNAATWTTPSPLASTGNYELDVASGPMNDGRVWVFWVVLVVSTGEFQFWATTSNAITGLHDVGVVSLSASSFFLRSGDIVSININVANYGDYSESTTLTVQLRTMTTNTTIQTTTLSLAAGEKRLVQFSWNTSQPFFGFWGRYNLTATLPNLPLENSVNLGDNYLSAGLMRISPVGDLDRNGKVDIVDAARLAFAYGSTPQTPLWDIESDINHDNKVDIQDAALLAFYYGNSVV